MNRASLTVISLSALALAAGVATAQQPEPEVPELEVEHLVNEGAVDAMIMELRPEDRTMTVEIESTGESAKLIVPENAEIIRTFPNNVQRHIELTDLNVGDMIQVQGVELEGVIHLRIIGLIA